MRIAHKAIQSLLLLSTRRSIMALSTSSCFTPPTIPNETLTAIQNLQPSSLWSHFAALSSIPRPSRHESRVLQYITSFAESKGLSWKRDAYGNICVFRPGSGGGENASPVILQGHVDMVTEKNTATNHDFLKDPILLRRFEKNGRVWIGARGTTLGADNGLGCAAALTLLDAPTSQPLPPIEALFTVEEETGLHGAMALDAKALGLTGKTMLNLDMEEYSELYVGCAGGGDTTITIPLERIDLPEALSEIVQVSVKGLMGGHSGLNIHEGRGNAVILCAIATQGALEAAGEGNAAMISMCGGDKHNAIPREASALIAVAPDSKEVVEKSIVASFKAAVEEFGLLEKGLAFEAKSYDKESISTCLDESSSQRLLAALLALPHGPIKYSHALPGLVETSNNVASINVGTDATTAKILTSTRSSIGTALENTRNKIKSVAFLAGGSVEQSTPYPGWAPNPSSKILDVSKRLLSKKLGGAEPVVNAVHAGLECGLLIEKLGGDVDVVSFGPTITGAHSPEEMVDAGTVPLFFELTEDILAEYALRN